MQKKYFKNKNELLDITKQISQLEDKSFELSFLYNNSYGTNIDVYDSKPKKLIKNIIMTEDDFINRKK